MLKWEERIKVDTMGFNTGPACSIGSVAYFSPQMYCDLYQFDYHSKKWSELHFCPETDYALVVVNNLLTTVGGRQNFNKLFSLYTTQKENWVERFPPMPHRRVHPAAVCTGPALIVTSGSDEHGEAQYTVDVMDTSTLQWFTAAASLPREIGFSSVVTVCGDSLYILGRIMTWIADPATRSVTSNPETTAVYCCSLQAILQSCQPPGTYTAAASMSQQAAIAMSRITDLPMRSASISTFCGQLIGYGGKVDGGMVHNDRVYCFDPLTAGGTWRVVGVIPSCGVCPAVTTLPENKLFNSSPFHFCCRCRT
jgi:hypothetical protein